MTSADDGLGEIRIATPCRADWAAMVGDDKRRFCGQCRLHVHNLSAMTAGEARSVLQASGKGRVCVRFHRRADGTVLTRDCPVGLRQRLRWAWLRAAALLSALWSASGCSRSAPAAPSHPRALMGEAPAAAPAPSVVMGDAVVPAEPALGRSAAPVPRR